VIPLQFDFWPQPVTINRYPAKASNEKNRFAYFIPFSLPRVQTDRVFSPLARV
jgi:hypothetical protein